MKTLIIGLGYIGTELADHLLTDGHEVVGLRRGHSEGPAPKQTDIEIRTGDISNPEGYANIEEEFDWVIHCASSSRGGMDAYRAVFDTGTTLLCEWLRRHRPQRFLFTSSTSVYPQTDGGVVNENSPASGAGETGRILAAAESAFLHAADEDMRTTILRVAGIYGPERGHLFLKYLKNEATITGDPNRYLNQIHRDDVVGAIAHLLSSETAPNVLNVADNEAVRQQAFFQWLSEQLGKPMPTHNQDPGKRKRAVTDKQVANNRLTDEVRYQLKFPTFREGYRSEIERLGL